MSLILLGCELRVLYHCTMCTRHPDLVSLDFYAIPIFHILMFTFTCIHIWLLICNQIMFPLMFPLKTNNVSYIRNTSYIATCLAIPVSFYAVPLLLCDITGILIIIDLRVCSFSRARLRKSLQSCWTSMEHSPSGRRMLTTQRR